MNRKGDLENAHDVLSVREVQQILGIGRNAAYELICLGAAAFGARYCPPNRRHTQGARSVPGFPVE